MYRFLDHLPLNSIFSFVEIDLTSIVSPEVLERHKESFQEREKTRSERTEKERAADKLLDKKYVVSIIDL